MAAAAGKGHNVGDIDDIELLKDEIDSAKAGADRYAKIESDDQAAKAQSLRARLNELSGKADKLREAEKRPHLDAGKAVDKRWQPLVREAKEVADTLRAAISAYETAKRNAHLDALRKTAEAAVKGATGVDMDLTPPPAAQVKGSYGRAANVGVERVLTGITDRDAVYAYIKDNADTITFITAQAHKLVKLGHEVPGCTWEERAKIT